MGAHNCLKVRNFNFELLVDPEGLDPVDLLFEANDQ